jgi:hypothetical protein
MHDLRLQPGWRRPLVEVVAHEGQTSAVRSANVQVTSVVAKKFLDLRTTVNDRVLLQTRRETAEPCKGATLQGHLESFPSVPATSVDGEERRG